VRVLAIVPVATGLLSVILGSNVIPDGDGTVASVESELRFYSAFWVGFGLYLWSLAPRIHERGTELRIASAVLVLGAAGRALAIADAGRPHTFFLVLLALEVLIPAVLVPWQARVARAYAA
jgi:hypothetical protein